MRSAEVAAEQLCDHRSVAFCSSNLAFFLHLPRSLCGLQIVSTAANATAYGPFINLPIMHNAMTLRTAKQLCGPQRSSSQLKNTLTGLDAHSVEIVFLKS